MSPTSSVQGKVQEEAWSEQKVSVTHFKVCGYIAYAHVSEELRQKMDDRSEKYIFVGYAEKSKGYRLYNIDTKKFLISRYVKFLEDKSWHEQETSNGKTPTFTIDEQQESEVKIPRLQVQGREAAEQHASSDEEGSETHKMRSLSDIYEQLHFSFLAYQPTNFEEVVKEKVWAEAMNEDIEAIEKNKTWSLVKFPTGKKNIGVK